MATLGFAARVNFDRLLERTRFSVPFGQSPFAFRRGNVFEQQLRKDRYAPVLGLLSDHLKYDVRNARVENVRTTPPTSEVSAMQARATRTEQLIAEVVRRQRTAANLIDGAVLTRVIGGVPAHFEADAVSAQFADAIHVGEVKSFPTVDGQADADKLGAALAQVSIYILLLRELVDRLGGDASRVSSHALIITPKNTGLTPTMVIKDVTREVKRAQRILDQAPNAVDLARSLPSDQPTFGAVADYGLEEAARIDAAHELADRVGTSYQASCLASCGMSRLCRERAERAGDPARIGGTLVRLLPNVCSLDRAAELATGAAPTIAEQPVAEQLHRAHLLRSRLAILPEARPPRARKRA